MLLSKMIRRRINMAKKIKFPLEMKEGNKVRTIEEFRLYFDAEKAIMYLLNGKLLDWLEDRHYEKYYQEVSEIDLKDDDILQKLCEALEIDRTQEDCDAIDLKKIENNSIKLARIRQYVEDKRIFDNLDLVAENQQELDRLVKKSCHQIFLFENSFLLPNNISDVSIVGINNPEVNFDTNEIIDFEKREVYFTGIKFGKKYQELVNKYNYEIKHKNDKKRHSYQASRQFDVRLSDQDRKNSKKLFELLENELIDLEFDVNVNTRDLYGLISNADLYGQFNIDKIGKAQNICMENAQLSQAFWNFERRNRD